MSLENSGEQLILALKVVVDEPLRHPSLRRQILDADILHAPCSEESQGDIKQLAPAGLGLQVAFSR